MPINEDDLTQTRLPRVYWKVVLDNKGEPSFVGTYKDQEGVSHTLNGKSLEGVLSSVFTVEDPGYSAGDVMPSTKGVVTLFDEEYVHQISTRIFTNFASSLASRLTSLKRGDYVRVGARKGRKKKVFFAEVFYRKPGEEEWNEAQWEPMSTDSDEKSKRTKEIFESHQAKSYPSTGVS